MRAGKVGRAEWRTVRLRPPCPGAPPPPVGRIEEHTHRIIYSLSTHTFTCRSWQDEGCDIAGLLKYSWFRCRVRRVVACPSSPLRLRVHGHWPGFPSAGSPSRGSGGTGVRRGGKEQGGCVSCLAYLPWSGPHPSCHRTACLGSAGAWAVSDPLLPPPMTPETDAPPPGSRLAPSVWGTQSSCWFWLGLTQCTAPVVT